MKKQNLFYTLTIINFIVLVIIIFISIITPAIDPELVDYVNKQSKDNVDYINKVSKTNQENIDKVYQYVNSL